MSLGTVSLTSDGGLNLPRISVIVPCLNQGRFLAEALDSVIKQKYPNLEIIVADGGSSDNSKEVINVYKQHIYLWKSEPDNGQSAAINWGMAQSTGEILCWLNSDDLFCDNALLLVGTAAAQHPECGLYIGNGLRRDLTGSLRPFCPHPLAFNRDVLRLGGPYVHQPSTFFRRAAWMGTGGLDAELRFCMDWDIVLRAAESNKVILINEFLAVTREYAETKTASGGLDRAVEASRVVMRHTGRGGSIGTIAILLDTVLATDSSNILGFDCLRHLFCARRAVGRALSDLTGGPDHFPTENDPDVITYQSPGSAALARKRSKGAAIAMMQIFRQILSDWGYALAVFGLRLAMICGLRTSDEASATLRSWRTGLKLLWFRSPRSKNAHGHRASGDVPARPG